MRFGIVVFPGTWSDSDCYHATHEVLGQDAEYVWHKTADLSNYDCIILPGGFSYGDYLRAGAIARFSPVMEALRAYTQSGGLVLGICNGFQILCESGLLPGVLMRNNHLQFRCQWTNLRVEHSRTPFSSLCHKDQILQIPISHGEGSYYVDAPTLETLNRNGQILLRYCDANGNITSQSNPNGALENIAGITNKKGNVLGMMPHPERCCETLLGGTDGKLIFQSIIEGVTK
ncbi:MAG: phosphoribosylformylglycinamidine synthase subunit PurQ [Chloroflexota bacterium]|nr:phosphoribosylformylglycinamidine synthase subunit PurQ [Chloroflexota bacterium]